MQFACNTRWRWQPELSHFGQTNTTAARILAMSRWVHGSLEKPETVALPELNASDAAQQTAIER